MAAKSETRSLMTALDSDTDSDVTEYISGKKEPTSRNGKLKDTLAVSEQGACCLNRRTTSFALSLSVVLNIVLFITLLAIATQRYQYPQVPAHVDGNPLSSNHSSMASNHGPLPPTSTLPITDTPVLTSAQPSLNASCPTSSPTPSCGSDANSVTPPSDPHYVNVFRDLDDAEIASAWTFLAQQDSLKIGRNSGNYVFNIELHVPVKSAVLKFWDSFGAEPPREALVSVVLRDKDPPVFRQYVVGPLPSPTSFKVNPRMKKDVPADRMTSHKSGEAYGLVRRLMQRSDVKKILRESFGADSFGCGGDRCLMFLAQLLSYGLVNTTTICFVAYYRVEFSTINPLPLQLIVSRAPSGSLQVVSVYYAGTTLSSVDELVKRYNEGDIHKVSMEFPGNAPRESSAAGTMNLRGKQFPEHPHPPPRQYQPQGPRFSIHQEHVRYLQWSFNVRTSIESGPQVWDIRWAGERIVYELSLQEIAVLYAGANPSASFAHLSDSAFGLGDKTEGLVPGVDCPDHAHFLPLWVLGRQGKARQLQNTVCVFEHNSAVPLRRHNTHSSYGGLVDHHLVVRSIIVEYNYDYIMDIVFHNNGALEVRLYATGYIMAHWFHYGELPFGFRVHGDSVGSVHHHLFHLKVDLDILGEKNRYETLDFGVDQTQWPWLDVLRPEAFGWNSSSTSSSTSSSSSSSSSSSTSTSSSSSSKGYQQISFTHHLRQTEKDALYHYDFDRPKYHVFYSKDKKNQFDHARAYRLQAEGFSKQVLPDAHPAVRSRKWMQQCMAVTERREEEGKSSSIFSMYDADDPVVDFERFHSDDDNIVDKDLVTWVTLGMHHIPHTEDVPNTPTVGTRASLLLLPFNFFPEDPSVSSGDAVRRDRAGLHTYGTPRSFSCLPRQYGWLTDSKHD